MRSQLALLVLVVALAAGVSATAQTPAAAGSEEAIQALRNDMQGARADLMAKALTLTADQAAKFWPMFEKFQAEQNVIIDAQLKGIQRYAEHYRTLTDADAMDLINLQLERDEQMNALRRKWLIEFQKVLPVRDAVRVIQVDRRIGNAIQVQISSKIPLVP